MYVSLTVSGSFTAARYVLDQRCHDNQMLLKYPQTDPFCIYNVKMKIAMSHDYHLDISVLRWRIVGSGALQILLEYISVELTQAR